MDGWREGWIDGHWLTFSLAGLVVITGTPEKHDDHIITDRQITECTDGWTDARGSAVHAINIFPGCTHCDIYVLLHARYIVAGHLTWGSVVTVA